MKEGPMYTMLIDHNCKFCIKVSNSQVTTYVNVDFSSAILVSYSRNHDVFMLLIQEKKINLEISIFGLTYVNQIFE